MQKIIAGNWKMHGCAAFAQALAEGVVRRVEAGLPRSQVVLCPPAPYLAQVAALVAGSSVLLGAQDCHALPEGAFTGDISAPMLRDAGCSYVIVGHSERRAYHHETDEQICHKALAAIGGGLVPIICVGETLEQRLAGAAFSVVAQQLAACLPRDAEKTQFVLAYEPVWAIGTGKSATPGDVLAMHRHIADQVGAGVRVLYGGSVKPGNAKEILHIPHVAGVLVGGASLVAEDFCAIVDAC